MTTHIKIINDTFKTHTVLQNGSNIDTERERERERERDRDRDRDRQTNRQTDRDREMHGF